MQRSLFAAFRSADGRSLARGLALLVVVSALFGGIAAGSAATGKFQRLCATAPLGMLPPGHDGVTCCPGMIGGTPFVPPVAAELPQRRPVHAASAPHAEEHIPRIRLMPGDGPRGPPGSA